MRSDEILSVFPAEIRKAAEELRLSAGGLQEIRLRAGRPVLIRHGNREIMTGRTVSREQVQETLSCLAHYSLYAYEDEIRQGFLSLPGGHRVGIAGKTVTEGSRVKTIGEISSLNIRFAHQVRGCADSLMPYLWEKDRLCHTLIASPPGKGKTTLLRDCIRQISDGCCGRPGKTVGVVDERSEIAGCCRGVPGNDVGMRTDVLDGCPKADGMMMLIRSMAPEVVAVDEIGGGRDMEAVRCAMNCGCTLLATVHGSSMGELLGRPALKNMVGRKMFERYIFLDPGRIPGRIGQVLDGRGRRIC